MPERLDTGERRDPGLSFGPADARPAAVLVLIVPLETAGAGTAGDGDGADPEAGLVLIHRVDRGGHHSGDVALPGGRVEPGDVSAAAAALREAAEEVGLDAAAAGVRVVGELEPFWIPVSGYRVTPVVAVADRLPALTAAPEEVEAISVVPLAAFLPDAPIELVETTVRGFPLRFGAYPVAGLRVWGATARILGQLGAVLGER
jgi:8-oxo-dGTP pyrophosphatase MutT (NUDIX family)